jgi:hypothetical protein
MKIKGKIIPEPFEKIIIYQDINNSIYKVEIKKLMQTTSDNTKDGEIVIIRDLGKQEIQYY